MADVMPAAEPRSELQDLLAGVWDRVLGATPESPEADFFAMVLAAVDVLADADGSERVVSLAGWLYSAVWHWYLAVHADRPSWPDRPWYPTKRAPSFADVLAASAARPGPQFSRLRLAAPSAQKSGHDHLRIGGRGLINAGIREVHWTRPRSTPLHRSILQGDPPASVARTSPQPAAASNRP